MKKEKLTNVIRTLNKRLFYLKHCFKLYQHYINGELCGKIKYGMICFGDMYDDYLAETFDICNEVISIKKI